MYPSALRTLHSRLNPTSRLRSNALVSFVAWCFACAVTACGSTVATSTAPSPTKGGVTLTPPPASLSASGAMATVAVRTQPECAWTASSEVSWITGLTPASGQGTAGVQIDVAANPDATSRQGDILVNGERARIRQDAAACGFELSSTDQIFTASGGSASVNVSTLAGCAWTAQADAPWVGVTSGAAGTGAGTVNFAV